MDLDFEMLETIIKNKKLDREDVIKNRDNEEVARILKKLKENGKNG